MGPDGGFGTVRSEAGHFCNDLLEFEDLAAMAGLQPRRSAPEAAKSRSEQASASSLGHINPFIG